MPLGYGSQVNF